MRILLFLLAALTAFAFLVSLFFLICITYRYFDLDRFFYRKEREQRRLEEEEAEFQLKIGVENDI